MLVMGTLIMKTTITRMKMAAGMKRENSMFHLRTWILIIIKYMTSSSVYTISQISFMHIKMHHSTFHFINIFASSCFNRPYNSYTHNPLQYFNILYQ